MARKLGQKEPLLSAVARQLGHAAGTLANLTNGLAKPQAPKGSRSASEAAKGETHTPLSNRAKRRVRKQPVTRRANSTSARASLLRSAGKKRVAARKAGRGRT